MSKYEILQYTTVIDNAANSFTKISDTLKDNRSVGDFKLDTNKKAISISTSIVTLKGNSIAILYTVLVEVV